MLVTLSVIDSQVWLIGFIQRFFLRAVTSLNKFLYGDVDMYQKAVGIEILAQMGQNLHVLNR